MQEIIDLEKCGWEALSGGSGDAADFYGDLLLDDAVMLFPGGMRIEGKKQILASFGDRPWSSFELEEPRVVLPADNIAILTYKARALRINNDPYTALISSTYLSVDGSWKLALHQQTPV